MSKIMKWNYKGKADIIYGEVKASKTPKIILAIIFSIIFVLSISAFLLRNYIYDFIFNPQIVINLNQDENFIYILDDINYGDEFIPNIENYIDSSRTLKYDEFINKENTDYTYELVENNIDTNTLGNYTFTYRSSNRLNSTEFTFKVNVIDTVGPTINFNDKVVDDTISIDIDEFDSFDPKSYIDSITDNYYTNISINDVSAEYFAISIDGSETNDILHSIDKSDEPIKEIYVLNITNNINEVLSIYEEKEVKLKDSINVYDITLDILKDYGVELEVDKDTDLDELLSEVEFECEIIHTTHTGFIKYVVKDGADNMTSQEIKLHILSIDTTPEIISEETSTEITGRIIDEIEAKRAEQNKQNKKQTNTAKPGKGGGGGYTYNCPLCGTPYSSDTEANACARTHGYD